MKRPILCLLAISLLIGFSQGQTKSLKIITYNIWYANPDAGENIWENRRDGVVRSLLEEKADIIGLQEVLFHQLTDLEGALPDYHWVGAGRDDGRQKGEFSPLLFNATRFDLKHSGTFWLSEAPDSAGSIGWDAACVRIVTWIELHDKLNKKNLFIFNTHFDHVGDTARFESAQLLKMKISAIANHSPVILTGDFNCLKDSAPYHFLIGQEPDSPLSDCRYSAGKKVEGPEYSYIGSPFSGQPGQIIDHIFVSGEFRVIRSVILDNCIEGKCPSDHLPVIAVLEIQ